MVCVNLSEILILRKVASFEYIVFMVGAGHLLWRTGA